MADDDAEAGGAKKPSDKRKVFLIVGATLGVLGAGTAVAYFMGVLIPIFAKFGGPSEETVQAVEALAPAPVFYELPEFLVNLSNVQTRPTFLKLRVSLELASEREAPKVEARMPLIVDSLHLYLRELRVEEIKGSEGMHRLQKELLTRVTALTTPARVEAVLFREIIVQ